MMVSVLVLRKLRALLPVTRKMAEMEWMERREIKMRRINKKGMDLMPGTCRFAVRC